MIILPLIYLAGFVLTFILILRMDGHGSIWKVLAFSLCWPVLIIAILVVCFLLWFR